MPRKRQFNLGAPLHLKFNPSRSRSSSLSSALRRLRQVHREHAVLEAGLDLVGVDALGHLERALEGTEAALRQVVVLLLLFLLLALLALDRQGAVGELDLDVLLVDAGQLGRDLVFLVLLDDIDGGRLPNVSSPRQNGSMSNTSSERAAAAVEAEILEQAVDLAPEIGKRRPLADPLSAVSLSCWGVW